MRSVTGAEATQLRAALEAGRRGAATLSQLALAHDLAVSRGLHQVATELRVRLHASTAQPASPQKIRHVARDVAVGILSGALTHHLLRGP